MAVSELKTANYLEILKEFRASFFAMSRLNLLPWTFVENELRRNKSSEMISDLLQQTCLHPLCQKFPPSVRYRRRFLSELIKLQEACGCEPMDRLYDALAEVLGAEETSECFKSYILPGGDAISLMENLAVISEGTTGLVTWEAALYLAEWAMDHQDVFTGKSVLELGSGVGLTGISICRCCRPHSFTFSDVHPSVLQKLRDNVRLNAPEARVEPLDWSAASRADLREIRPDVVIAADVVYDAEVAQGLVKFLSEILKDKVQPDVFICSTVRNSETYSSFLQRLDISGIITEVIADPVRQVFPYIRPVTMELIKLSR